MIVKRATVNGEIREAVFGEGGISSIYRYTLKILWGEDKMMQVIGLNPSTADHLQDDNTVRRCKSFARREGCGGLIMTNLFAYRSVSPAVMKAHELPISPRHGPLSCAPVYGDPPNERRFEWVNDGVLWTVYHRCHVRVAAWGNHGGFTKRSKHVREFLSGLMCFRMTKASEPEHPLYMPSDQPLMKLI